MTLDELRATSTAVDEVSWCGCSTSGRACVCEIGRLKKELGVEIYQPDREKRGAARTSRHRRRDGRPLGPDGDRPPVRTHHRRGAAPRAAHRPGITTNARPTRSAADMPTSAWREPRVRMWRIEAMVVVMQERATEEQIEKVVARLVEMGIGRAPLDRRDAHGARRRRRGPHPIRGCIEMLDGVQRGAAHHRAVQAGEPHVQARRHRRVDRATSGSAATKSSSWRVRARLRASEQVRATAAAVQTRRREGPARRRLQAAQLALQLPGPRRRRPADAARRARISTRPQAGLRGDGRRARSSHRASTATCSRSARATCRTSRCCASSAARRKPVLLKRGISATIEEWLLSAEYMLSGGNNEVDPVRARHPHVRELHAEHARHLRDPGGQEAEPPADHRRSEPRYGPPRQGRADGACGGGRRRRRPAHRGPLRSGPRAERRRAVDVPGAVRSSDGGAADHRARDRPEHLSRARHAARLGRVNEPGSFPVRHLGHRRSRTDRRLGGDGCAPGLARRAGGGVDSGAALDARAAVTAFDVARRHCRRVAWCRSRHPRRAGAARTSRCLPALATVLDQPALITDTGSTKRATVAAAARLPDRSDVRRRTSARRRRARRARRWPAPICSPDGPGSSRLGPPRDRRTMCGSSRALRARARR